MQNIRIASLLLKIKEYRKVVIYGTGYYAKSLCAFLFQANIIPMCCVMTNKTMDYFEGKVRVYSIDEACELISSDEIIIIVAANRPYSEEIRWELRNREVDNFLMLTDYLRNWQWPFLEMNALSNEEYKIDIAEWLVLSGRRRWEDLESLVDELNGLSTKKECEKKVVFIVFVMTPRIIKIIGALTLNGYIVDVMALSNFNCQHHYEVALEGMGVLVRRYESEEELVYNIWNEPPCLIHLFSHGGSFTHISYNIVMRKELFPPIIFEVYDIMNGMYMNTNPNATYEERYCLENADGVVNRGFELDVLCSKMGFRIKKSLQFYDYCNDIDIDRIEIENDLSDELSICYAGSFTTGFDYPDLYSTCWDYLIEWSEKNKCHFHVYASNYSESKHKEYIHLGKKLSFFHFHEPVPYEKLSREIARFDYGILPLKRGALEREIIGRTTNYKIMCAVTNKFYDYLDAGIPIIAYGDFLFCKEFEKEGILLYRPVEEYNVEELRCERVQMKRKVPEIQRKMQISKNIYRLCDFYDSILTNDNK